MDRQTYGQTDKWTDRQMDRQTNPQTFKESVNFLAAFIVCSYSHIIIYKIKKNLKRFRNFEFMIDERGSILRF
jgi:hypothetical protein